MAFMRNAQESSKDHMLRSKKYEELLKHLGFITDVNENGRVYADIAYDYYGPSLIKDIHFCLHAWGNFGVTFYKRLGIEIPRDVLQYLPKEYAAKIKGLNHEGLPPVYFLAEGSKEQMSTDLEALILEIAKAKYTAKHGRLWFWQNKPRLRATVAF